MLTFHLKQVIKFNLRNKSRLILAVLVIGIAISTMFTLNGLLDVFGNNVTTSVLAQAPNADFAITSISSPYIYNYSTLVSKIEKNDSLVTAVTPRYSMDGGVFLTDSQGNSVVVPATIIAINLTEENQMGLGSFTPQINSLGVDECLVVGSFGSQLLAQAQNTRISVSMHLTANLSVTHTLTIKSQVEQNKKFSSLNQNLIIIDYNTLNSFNLSTTATSLLGLFSDHNSFYSINSIDSINQNGVQRGTQIQNIIGYHYTVNLLILKALTASQTSLNGDRVLVNLIGLIVLILSTILIFSMMNSSFKDLTHEYGIYKSLGLKNKWIFLNAFWNSVVIGFLGIMVGFVLGFIFINYANSSLGAVNVLIDISPTTFLYILGVGILMILFSGLYPAYVVSKKDVLVSLDMSRAESTDFQGRVVSYRFKLLNLKNVFLGLVLLSVGVYSFVILPSLSHSGDLNLQTDVFILVLISALMGLIFIISGLFGPVLQNVISRVLSFFFPKVGFATNLFLRKSGNRNSSNAVIFAICLAFIFFLNVLIAVSFNGAIYNLQSQIGADAIINTPQVDGTSYSAEIYNYTESYSGIVSGFVTNSGFYNLIGSTVSVGDDINFNSFSPAIYGVTTNLPDALMNQIIAYPGSNFTAVGNNNTIVICGSLARALNLNIGDTLRLDVQSPIQANQLKYGKTLQVKVVAIMKSLQGIPSISDNIADAPTSPVFIGQQTWQNIVKANSGFNDTNHFIFDEQIHSIFIKDTGANLKNFENQIFIKFGSNANIIDYQDQLNGLERGLSVIENVLTLILSFSTIIALFAVISSTVSFINESKGEIAIMKALGIKERQITLIFMAESVIVCTTASLLGSIAGYLTGYLDYYPETLITSQPLELVLPPLFIIFTFGLVILFAILGSYFPARRVYKIDTIQNLTLKV